MSRKRRHEMQLSSKDDEDKDYTKEVQSSKKEAYKKHLDKTGDKSRCYDEDSIHHRNKKTESKYNWTRTKSSMSSDKGYTDQNLDIFCQKTKVKHRRCIESSSYKSKDSKNLKHEKSPSYDDENVHSDFKATKTKHEKCHRSKKKVGKNTSSDQSKNSLDKDIHTLSKKSKGIHDQLYIEIHSNRYKSNESVSYERSQLLASENSHHKSQDNSVVNKSSKNKARSNKDVNYDDEGSMHESFKTVNSKYHTIQRCNVKSTIQKNSFCERSESSSDDNIDNDYEKKRETKSKYIQKAKNTRPLNEVTSSAFRNDKSDEVSHNTFSMNTDDEPQSVL